MSFISYAQNYEDVMLWRALKHVKHGFYIDVGANDPLISSVTKLFSENGWSGINIEPMTGYFEALINDRPRDTNIPCAIGNKEGRIDIWQSEVKGWESAEKEVIERQKAEGVTGRYENVPIRTLKGICDEYAPDDIHFLKIDVEGMEKEVIEGADFEKYRPWIIVIESTIPNSNIENHRLWESLVLSSGYRLAYKDGLNRFYVSQEKEELVSAFEYPPNVFDDFKLAGVKTLEGEINNLKLQIESVNCELNRAYSSISWKTTKPLRLLGRLYRQFKECDKKNLLNRGRLKQKLITILKKVRLYKIVRRIVKGKHISSQYIDGEEIRNPNHIVYNAKSLSTSARKIYDQIKQAQTEVKRDS